MLWKAIFFYVICKIEQEFTDCGNKIVYDILYKLSGQASVPVAKNHEVRKARS